MSRDDWDDPIGGYPDLQAEELMENPELGGRARRPLPPEERDRMRRHKAEVLADPRPPSPAEEETLADFREREIAPGGQAELARFDSWIADIRATDEVQLRVFIMGIDERRQERRPSFRWPS